MKRVSEDNEYAWSKLMKMMNMHEASYSEDDAYVMRK